MGIAPTSTQFGSIPFSRRVGRRCLQLIRPLALPFLVRLKRWISLGVDESRSAQMMREALAGQNDMRMRLDVIANNVRSLSDAVQELREQTAPSVAQLLAEQRAGNTRLQALKQTADALNIGVEKSRELAAVAAEYSSKLLQARALSLGDEVLTRSPFGWLLLPAEDVALIEVMLETGGVLEPGIVAVMQALLQPGDLVVDVGANVGMLTLAMARSVAPEGRVLAVEPTPRTAALLRRTCAFAGLDQMIQIEECAAGAKEGTAMLRIGRTSGHNSLMPLEKETGSVAVEVRSLDAMLPSGSVPALIKIDAEGSELDVWYGMARTVRDAPNMAIIVEFGPHHLRRSGVSIEAWIAALTAPGFTLWEIDDESQAIRPLRSSGLEEVSTINLLLLRDSPSRWPRLRVTA
jgi:FkbM family methyltransferase